MARYPGEDYWGAEVEEGCFRSRVAPIETAIETVYYSPPDEGNQSNWRKSPGQYYTC